MLFVVFIITIVFPSIRPSVDSFSVEFVLFPFTLINSAIRPPILSFALDIVVNPVAYVNAFIGPLVCALSPLLSILKHTIIFWPIFKLFFSRSILVVIFPESFISLSVRVHINSEPISSILEKLSCIHITVSVIKSALSLRHSISPVTVILGSVAPCLLSFPVLYINLFLCFGVDN